MCFLPLLDEDLNQYIHKRSQQPVSQSDEDLYLVLKRGDMRKDVETSKNEGITTY